MVNQHKNVSCLLAIESSCDETSCGIYLPKQQALYQEIYSQIQLHQTYGGVVPELASRSHLEKMYGIIERTLAKSGCRLQDVDAIAYTRGPGLVGPLLIGATYADALAFALQVPLIPVHHLEAHITIALHEYVGCQFPFLALIVSGGHTELVFAHALGQYTVLGATLDDAVGEAFDKCGKIMGLPYPAGPMVAQMADAYDQSSGIPVLPEPLKTSTTLDFSFSGLKSAFLRQWEQSKMYFEPSAFAYAIQSTIVTCLVRRVKQAFAQHPDCPLVVAGGVAANAALRKNLKQLAQDMQRSIYFPSVQYCTDNGGMIAYNAYLRLQAFGSDVIPKQKVQPRWPIETL